VAGLAADFGSGAMTNSIPEIEDASCVLAMGSNTTEAHPLVSHRVFKAKLKGATLIIVDPRKIQLTLAADIHVRLNFGTDVAFINGMMHAILKNNWHNSEFVSERTEGFAELQAHLEKYPPEKASEICGVPPEEIERVARIYATSERSTILYTLGITEHSHGVDNVKSVANLAMLTGQIGRRSTGVNPLRGQNNVQGHCDMGALPNVYPGYQVVTDPNVRQKFEAAWNVHLSDKVGITIPEMMDWLIDGSAKGMFIFGENPVLSDPNTQHVVHALKSAEFLVVQDIFLTETAKLAHVVLPGASWAEKDGTFSSTERKMQRVRKARAPAGDPAGLEDILRTRLQTRTQHGLRFTERDLCRNGRSFADVRRNLVRTSGIGRDSVALPVGRSSWDAISASGKVHSRPRAFQRHRLSASGGTPRCRIPIPANHRTQVRSLPYSNHDRQMSFPPQRVSRASRSDSLSRRRAVWIEGRGSG